MNYLTPNKSIRKYLSSKKEADLKDILYLHEKYKISKEAAVRRYIELTDHEIGLVLGHNRTVRYTIRTKEFPYIDLKSKNSLPEHISCHIKDNEVGTIIDWYSVEPAYFVSDDSIEELYCQTLIQKEGHTISLIALD